MKPDNWDKLDKSQRREIAIKLFMSDRGQYLVSEALYTAIEVMRKVPKERREVSNIEDMEILLEELFPLYKMVKDAIKEYDKRVKLKKNKGCVKKRILNEDIEGMKRILRWLYGGNFSMETVNKFNNIITGFGSLAIREQEDILEILQYMAKNMYCLDEDEILEWIENTLKEGKENEKR